jgi:hypothetical protein
MQVAQDATAAKLNDIRQRIRRWQNRQLRASNALNKLYGRERRLLAKSPEPLKQLAPPKITSEAPLPELDAFFQPEPKPVEQIAALDIPEELKRTSVLPKAGDPGPKLLEDMLNPAAVMNRLRLAKLDAKRRGRPTEPVVDKTAMPLSGRDAMKAIRRKR